MKSFFRVSVTVFSILLGLTSCKKETVLTVSPNSLFFSSASVTKTFDVSCNADWSIADAPEWLACEPSSGSGNASVKVSITDQSGFSFSGTVNVKAGPQLASVNVKVSGTNFTISQETFEFDVQCTPQTAEINSKEKWEISKSSAASWIDIEPMKGEAGRTVITLTPKPITDRTPRNEQIIDISYGSGSYTSFNVSQTMPNSAPQAPVLVSPADGEEGVNIDAEFQWSRAEDADNDILTYELTVTSADGKNTYTAVVEDKLSARLPEFLFINTTYEWQVKVSDPFGGTAVSGKRSFTTNSTGAWGDREYRIIQNATAGAPKPVNLLVLGDGYVDTDYFEGGKFDRDLERAVDAFFSIEPYKTYRNYFRIVGMAAYSQESGATVKADMAERDGYSHGCPRQTRNTVFSSELEGGYSTGITCGATKVFNYATTIDGIDDKELDNMTVLLMINLDVYAGTCITYQTGRSIAMCPVGYRTFETIVNHECGGHGFARVLDEYINYKDETVDYTTISKVRSFRDIDPYYANNIDLTGSVVTSPWAHLYGRAGYEAVGHYEGSLLYGKGAWRPERISCMCDNRPYYNAPTREAIVRRIMKVAGIEFSIDDFVAKDWIKKDDTGIEPPAGYLSTKSAGMTEALPPLAPPVMISNVQ